MRRRMGRPGLLGTAARTAVVAGTASATVNAVNRRQAAGAQQAAPAPAPPPAPAAGGDDLVSKLGELAQLHQQGVLTDAEFTAAKQRLLG
ncbi:SHOCT domain-containing protein [Nocardioides sp. CN2-186]|uniref:SHOCT domain-containing protein n=1 Tax=Nocardioides tweenelious TaxID=3156607 RepID=UPI0032B59441